MFQMMPDGRIEADVPGKPLWMQAKEEPRELYSYFAVFRNTGPKRTLLKAYQRYCEKVHPGQELPAAVPIKWRRASADWYWFLRVPEWDAYVAEREARIAAHQMLGCVRGLADKLRAAIKELDTPATWKEALDIFNVLKEIIPQESLQALVQNNASPDGRCAVWSTDRGLLLEDVPIPEQPGGLREGGPETILPVGPDGGHSPSDTPAAL